VANPRYGATGTSRYGPYLLREGYQIAAISPAVTAAAAMANPAMVQICHRALRTPNISSSLGNSRLRVWGTGLPRYRTSCPCGEQRPRSRNVRKNGPRRSGLCRGVHRKSRTSAVHKGEPKSLTARESCFLRTRGWWHFRIPAATSRPLHRDSVTQLSEGLAQAPAASRRALSRSTWQRSATGAARCDK
jgi:hypothetical protein